MIDESRDPHVHRNLEAVEQPLDAAHQSLADALRASFGVLKLIMLLLVLLYLASNVRSIDSHEEALVLRLGNLHRVVERPGLIWAFPFPIDEIVPLPTKKSNELLIDSHTFHRSGNEIGKPLSFISRGPNEPLNPSLDGALLTADAGLVHVRWKATYKFKDVSSYVTNIAGDKIEAAEKLIRTFVETTGIEVASERTAEEMIRTRVDFVQSEMKRRINARLAGLQSGVEITEIAMYEPTPPIQVRRAFDATQQAENRKQQTMRTAQKDRTRILSLAAGASHKRLIRLLDNIDRAGTNERSVKELRTVLDRILDLEAEGEAGKRIKNAGAYRTVVVSRMQADVERYRALLPEYRRNPMMLINRLWEQTKQQIYASPGVTKFYRPQGLREFRVKIPLDPEAVRSAEEQRLLGKRSDVSKLHKERWVPVGPEYD